VWGRGPTEAWAVGEEGVVLRWNGAEWRQVSSPTDAYLLGVGAAPEGLLAVGLRRTVLRAMR